MVNELANYDVEYYIHFIVGFHIILFSGVYLFMSIIMMIRKIYNNFNKN
jgi:hypothetical protein